MRARDWRITALLPLIASIIAIVLLGMVHVPGTATDAQHTGTPQGTGRGNTGATAIITVTTFADDLTANGNCSLREAVQSANTAAAVDACAMPGTTNTIIRLAAGGYTLTLAGANEDANQSGDLDLLAAMEFIGQGNRETAIDGASIDRVIHVHTGAVATIKGVTLRNGAAPDGEVIDQAAEPGRPGGAIFNSGELTLLESAVTASRAGTGASSPSDYFSSDRGGDGGDGGGIYNDGTLHVTRSAVLQNTTGSGGEGPCGGGGTGGDGGGIYNGGWMTVTESNIRDNMTGSGGRVVCPPGIFAASSGAGGGIANHAVAVVDYSSVIANSTAAGADVFGTHARGGRGGPGGGIANTGSLHIDTSTVSGNEAGNGGSGGVDGGGAGGDGGGIYNAIGGSLAIDATTVTQNRAGVAGESLAGTGGGADGEGGGIATTEPLQARNMVVAGNVARRAPDCAGTLDSYDYNLIELVDGCTLAGTVTHVLTGTPPLLGALAGTGGPTLTHDPLLASPLRDGGACTDILGSTMSRDQRGLPRPMDVTCDMGAVEWGFAAWQWLPAIKFAD